MFFLVLHVHWRDDDCKQQDKSVWVAFSFSLNDQTSICICKCTLCKSMGLPLSMLHFTTEKVPKCTIVLPCAILVPHCSLKCFIDKNTTQYINIWYVPWYVIQTHCQKYCFVLFQPFIFELFICVSDLFFGLCLISVRPLVNLLVALHFAAMQLKVLFWWSTYTIYLWKVEKELSVWLWCRNLFLNVICCALSLSLSFFLNCPCISKALKVQLGGEEWRDLWGVSMKGPPGLLRAVC